MKTRAMITQHCAPSEIIIDSIWVGKAYNSKCGTLAFSAPNKLHVTHITRSIEMRVAKKQEGILSRGKKR
jgi:hypothetical protein